MFCVSCGKQLEDGAMFCEHCGAKQEAAPAAAPVIPTAPAGAAPGVAAAPAAAKKPMDPKTKLALIIVAAVVVVFFGLKAILGSINAPDKTIGKFLEAIRNQDVDAFNKVATVQMEMMELNEETLAPFFAAYSTSTDAMTAFQQDLMADLQSLNTTGIANGNGFMRLTKKSNFLFDSYKVELTPVDVTFWSEFDGTEVSFGPYTVTAGTDGMATVTMLPGLYNGEATVTADTGVDLDLTITNRAIGRDLVGVYYATSSSSAASEWNGSYGGGDLNVNLEFAYSNAYIESANRVMELKAIYIDGVEYTGDLSVYQEDFYYGFYFGPVKADSEVRVVATAYGLDFEKTSNMNEDTSVYVRMELSEDLQNEAMAIAEPLGVAYAKVRVGYNEAARQEIATNAYCTDAFKTEVNDWLTQYTGYANNYTYIRNFVSEPVTEVYVENTSFSDSGIQVQVRVNFEVNAQYQYYLSGAVDGDPFAYSNWSRVYLNYANGQWTVTDIYF